MIVREPETAVAHLDLTSPEGNGQMFDHDALQLQQQLWTPLVYQEL